MTESTKGLIDILDNQGLSAALRALALTEGYEREIQLFAASCLRMMAEPTIDKRSRIALEVAKRYTNGLATETSERQRAKTTVPVNSYVRLYTYYILALDSHVLLQTLLSDFTEFSYYAYEKLSDEQTVRFRSIFSS